MVLMVLYQFQTRVQVLLLQFFFFHIWHLVPMRVSWYLIPRFSPQLETATQKFLWVSASTSKIEPFFAALNQLFQFKHGNVSKVHSSLCAYANVPENLLDDGEYGILNLLAPILKRQIRHEFNCTWLRLYPHKTSSHKLSAKQRDYLRITAFVQQIIPIFLGWNIMIKTKMKQKVFNTIAKLRQFLVDIKHC